MVNVLRGDGHMSVVEGVGRQLDWRCCGDLGAALPVEFIEHGDGT